MLFAEFNATGHAEAHVIDHVIGLAVAVVVQTGTAIP
jgi:hypothetical protein